MKSLTSTHSIIKSNLVFLGFFLLDGPKCITPIENKICLPVSISLSLLSVINGGISKRRDKISGNIKWDKRPQKEASSRKATTDENQSR